jgi:hypothetical protein
MVYIKKTWREKLNDVKDLPKVVEVPDDAISRWGGKRIAIPLPKDVDNWMRKVPKGKLQTINQIRENAAKKYNADNGCPICCGIFSVIAAHVASEEIIDGKKIVTPFWRTIKSDGSLNPKYPGGVKFQSDQLESEGFKIKQTGKEKFRVKNFEDFLI